jgi:hypothetical protein
VGEELSAIRTGLHDLETKLERIESRITQGTAGNAAEQPRARLIDFVSATAPLATRPSIASSPGAGSPEPSDFVPPTLSPWLATMSSRYSPPSRQGENENPQSPTPGSPAGQPRWGGSGNPQSAAHPSQERFGVEEATVAELVEFFENEKKCSVDPSGKPCDHCAMCSSRGF